jgi:hypothetical protein
VEGGVPPPPAAGAPAHATPAVITPPKLKGGLRAFSRRQLAVLARLAEHAAAGLAAGGGTGGGAPDAADAHTVQTLVWLLLPYLRAKPGRRPPARAGGGGASLDDPEDDPALLVLRTIARLAPHLATPAPYIPYFSGLLAPGPRALEGAPRAAAVAVLAALGGHAALGGALAPGLALLTSLASPHARRLGELDYDAVMAGVEALMAPAAVAALFTTPPLTATAAPAVPAYAAPPAVGGKSGGRKAAAAAAAVTPTPAPATPAAPPQPSRVRGAALAPLAPALLHQLAGLMHDSDLAARTGALNALSAVV